MLGTVLRAEWKTQASDAPSPFSRVISDSETLFDWRNYKLPISLCFPKRPLGRSLGRPLGRSLDIPLRTLQTPEQLGEDRIARVFLGTRRDRLGTVLGTVLGTALGTVRGNTGK